MNNSLAELERIAEDIRVRLHLASLDVKTEWNEKLEPKVFEAKTGAREVIDDLIGKLRAFANRIP